MDKKGQQTLNIFEGIGNDIVIEHCTHGNIDSKTVNLRNCGMTG
jgi:hypothetical protein